MGEDEETDEVSGEAFEFRVTGQDPKPWGVGKGEWTWRAAVASVARAVRKAAGYSGPVPAAEVGPVLVGIEIVFRMSPSKFLNADLDNLAKPVLHTLFRAKRVQAPVEAGDVSGGLFGFAIVASIKCVVRAALRQEILWTRRSSTTSLSLSSRKTKSLPASYAT